MGVSLLSYLKTVVHMNEVFRIGQQQQCTLREQKNEDREISLIYIFIFFYIYIFSCCLLLVQTWLTKNYKSIFKNFKRVKIRKFSPLLALFQGRQYFYTQISTIIQFNDDLIFFFFFFYNFSNPRARSLGALVSAFGSIGSHSCIFCTLGL